ncbi:MAG: hypothetical protein JNN20_01865 [Betaproteobacteria bacterium]|nr:hypothetical protein [Betaproteobacteria bacterium]
MSDTIAIDRFTRLKQSVSGKFLPAELPRLAEFLAGQEGEISYVLTGQLTSDVTGSQKRRVKCIISGWFLLVDPIDLQSVRHELAIESKLVLVSDESELPPLELESEGEDYVVCGAELEIKAMIEEEVLLDLPITSVSGAATADAIPAKPKAPAMTPGKKISPFAKLAELKKK